MSIVSELLEANAHYAATFTKGDLPIPPVRRMAIVTCMDARINAFHLFGLQEGDAHVIRNAGGRTAEAIRSIAISERLLGTNLVAVVHHTDCGMLRSNNAEFRQAIADELGEAAAGLANAIDFQFFPDLEQSVRDDVALVRESPLIPDSVQVAGFIYNVKTGLLTHIV